MSEEIKKNEEEQKLDEVITEEVKEEHTESSKEEQPAEAETVEAPVEEESKEDVQEPEGKDEEVKEEEKEEEKKEEEVPTESAEEEKVEGAVVEEEKKEEEKEEEPKEEPLPQVEAKVEDAEVEDIKKKLAEKEAELEEEKAIKSYENDVREANRQLDEFLVNLGNAMAQEFAKYGIDVNTNLDELRKTDPAKAQVAENIINQAQAVKNQAMKNVNTNLNDRLTDIVFEKASRLFDKFELTQEQSMLAAETFVNILEQTGVKDIGEDLVAKVELAAARAKMLKPKVEKVVEEVKEIVEEAKEAVKEVIEEKAEVTEEEKKTEETKEEEAPAIESIVEAPSIDEFKEGAVTSNQAAGDPVTVDNVLDKMASLPFKDRVRFYADHKELAEEAMAKKSNADSRRKRV